MRKYGGNACVCVCMRVHTQPTHSVTRVRICTCSARTSVALSVRERTRTRERSRGLNHASARPITLAGFFPNPFRFAACAHTGARAASVLARGARAARGNTPPTPIVIAIVIAPAARTATARSACARRAQRCAAVRIDRAGPELEAAACPRTPSCSPRPRPPRGPRLPPTQNARLDARAHAPGARGGGGGSAAVRGTCTATPAPRARALACEPPLRPIQSSQRPPRICPGRW